jgi:hypothetical protein
LKKGSGFGVQGSVVGNEETAVKAAGPSLPAGLFMDAQVTAGKKIKKVDRPAYCGILIPV